MKHGWLILCLVTVLSGCRTVKKSVVESNTTTDSVRTETRFITEVVHDTCYYELPQQSAERETRDTISHLENDYASSDASVSSDGILHHTLMTKQISLSIPTENKIVYKDSIIYRYKNVFKTHEVEVEKSLPWWQRVRLYIFWIVLGYTVVTTIYMIKLHNRS